MGVADASLPEQRSAFMKIGDAITPVKRRGSLDEIRTPSALPGISPEAGDLAACRRLRSTDAIAVSLLNLWPNKKPANLAARGPCF